MTTLIYHEGSSDPAMAAAQAGAASESLVERLARFFREHPDEWIDGRQISRAGYGGFRSRISDLRKLGLVIINRQSRVVLKSETRPRCRQGVSDTKRVGNRAASAYDTARRPKS